MPSLQVPQEPIKVLATTDEAWLTPQAVCAWQGPPIGPQMLLQATGHGYIQGPWSLPPRPKTFSNDTASSCCCCCKLARPCHQHMSGSPSQELAAISG